MAVFKIGGSELSGSQSRQELICGTVPVIICGVIGSFIGWAIGSARAAEMFNFNPDGFGEALIAVLFFESDIPQLLPVAFAACGALFGLVAGVFPYCMYRVFVAYSSQKHIEAASQEKLRDALESRKSR